jgi:hypothetical protein
MIFFPFALQPGFDPASRARVVYAVSGPNPSKSSVTGWSGNVLPEFSLPRLLPDLLPRLLPEGAPRIYVNSDNADVPGFSIFTRRNRTVRHFYSSEMSSEMADPGQDPRGAPDLDPLWSLLDWTPKGRGTDWYPNLDYTHKD